MKLLIVTSLKEYQENVADIFMEAQINVFSSTNTIGHKGGQNINMLDNWFASGEDQFDSVFQFSVTEDFKALAALELVNQYNKKVVSEFPLRAFILPVEQSSD